MKAKSEKIDYYDLVIAFKDLIKLNYSFLENYDNFTFSCGYHDYNINKIMELKPPIYAWFNIIAKFTIKKIEFEISYGDREFIIIPRIKINNRLFGLWEILKAQELDYSEISDCQFIYEYEQLKTVIERQAKSFKSNIEFILSINKKIIRKIDANRTDIQKKYLDDLKIVELNRNMDKSKNLFKEHNYMEIIELLKPYIGYFNKSQLMFYKLCVKYEKRRPTTGSS